MAAERGNFEVIKKIWGWTEVKMTAQEIKKELLLDTDGKGMTAWHNAAHLGNVDAMREIWELAKERLTTER